MLAAFGLTLMAGMDGQAALVQRSQVTLTNRSLIIRAKNNLLSSFDKASTYSSKRRLYRAAKGCSPCLTAGAPLWRTSGLA